jgi:hypothetical protein
MSIMWRGELWELGWSLPDQDSYNSFGLISRATLPDPVVEWSPFYSMGTASNNCATAIFDNIISLSGSFPDVVLLNGKLLPFLLGTCTYTDGLHTISPNRILPSMDVRADYYGADDELDVCDNPNGASFSLARVFKNGKVNSATLYIQEGDCLRLSLDEVLFTRLLQNSYDDGDTFNAITEGMYVNYSGQSVEMPYFFSGGDITIGDYQIAEITELRIQIKNNLEKKYYIQNNRFPHEILNGRKEYRISVRADVKDTKLYNNLMSRGYSGGNALGIQITADFSRDANPWDASGDAIRITAPYNTIEYDLHRQGCFVLEAPHEITEENMTSVNMQLIAPSLKILVNDPNCGEGTYPGE